jgi:hypothetical protein
MQRTRVSKVSDDFTASISLIRFYWTDLLQPGFPGRGNGTTRLHMDMTGELTLLHFSSAARLLTNLVASS